MYISTRTHGTLDYVVGSLLVILPWLLGFARGGPETWVPVLLGLGTIAYSSVTDYERGFYRILSMRTHLALDAVAGFLLLISPWVFGFAAFVWIPHVLVAIVELLVTAMTRGPERRPIRPV